MTKKGYKNINIEISLDCWRKLKMLSISKDETLQDIVRDILEKYMEKKKFEIIKTNES